MIPSVIRKKEIREKWYADYPNRDVHDAIMTAVQITGKNTIYKHTLEKQEIFFIIKWLGLPDQFSVDEWYEYIEDPFIVKNPKVYTSYNRSPSRLFNDDL